MDQASAANNKTLIVMAVNNEEHSLPELLRELKSSEDFDLIVVDDCSSDNTLSICRNAGILTLPLASQLGAWGAMQTGLRYAVRRGYRQVITMDGDGQHHTAELSVLTNFANEHPEHDVIIGACVSRGSRLRRWAWSFFRRTSGIEIEDITSGFRLYRGNAVDLLSDARATLLDYQDLGVLLQLHRSGLRIGEVAVSMSERADGKSRIFNSWLTVARYMLFTTMLAIAKSQIFRPFKR